ncbi:MAG: hypothetical protein COW84_02260 [Gammaproteobacteria bacterium CG22_combo_CG10-13_8_21_14_all_40_8]|nr:MAG: hypothetical protein COW84_02260 [Gammaproteobacteria bacterium CG22_combo_CG10-13_8_21_14_all_40_8]
MALMNCPFCRKRISDRHTKCPECSQSLDQTDDEQAERVIYQQQWKKRRLMQYLQFATVSIFMLGCFSYWIGLNDPNSWQAMLGKILLAIGFVGYAVLRIRKLLSK